jgi:hypothetical protein
VSRGAPALLAFLVASPLLAQKDVSLETLARAMEGRLGIYAKNLSTGDEVAINADKEFDLGATSRPSSPKTSANFLANETRPAERSARKWAKAFEILPRGSGILYDRMPFAGALSPTIDLMGAQGTDPRHPYVAGRAATAQGDMIFGVMADGLASGFTAASVFPEVVEACFRRLVPSFAERLPDSKAEGLVLVSLHEKNQDPNLFPKFPDAAVADSRRGAQRLKHRIGDVARLAVLARPAADTRVTVQWWSPTPRPEACTADLMLGGKVSDTWFDQPLEKTGTWRVRVAFGDVIVLDETFYVTGK